jgi:hypothetical protein
MARTTFQRTFARTILCAAFSFVAVPSFVATIAHEAKADDVAYVDCTWTPFKEAWACALPSGFKQGRFAAPPDFRHDERSVQTRQRAWAEAKTEPGARSRGRVGVFVPANDGGWLFVPGTSWSPGDPVFLPPAKTKRGR